MADDAITFIQPTTPMPSISIKKNEAILSYQSNTINVYEKRTEEDRRQDCMKALRLTESISDGAKITTSRGIVAPGTCQWIEKVDKFESWRTGSTPFLWISGLPGKGKTFLCVFLVEMLRKMHKNSVTPLVLEYFCDNRDNRRNTAHAVLTDLIYQLLECAKCCKIPDNLDRLYEVILNPFETWGKNLFSLEHRDDLWNIFEKMVSEFNERIYLVLDGLDECDESSIEYLRAKFERIYHEGNFKRNLNIRTAIVSRELERITKGATMIDLDERAQETEHDLELFIDYRAMLIPQLQGEAASDQRCKLRRILLDRANGTFLWVALAMDMLNDDEVGKILKSKDAADKLLPRGLDDMINRMLLDILGSENEAETGTKAEDAAKIIRWVSLAFRPLTVAELRTATRVGSLASIRKCKHILTLPKGEIRDDTELQLIHLSLKEYLLRPSLMFSPSVGLSLRPHLLRPLGYVLRQSDVLYLMDYIIFATILLWARDLLLRYLAPSFFTIAIGCLTLWRHRKSSFSRSFLQAFELSLKLCIFNVYEKEAHKDWFLKCLELMDQKDNRREGFILRRNMCNLQSPGSLVNDVPKEIVEQHLPRSVRYACRYWVEHLKRSKMQFSHNGPIHNFLRKSFFPCLIKGMYSLYYLQPNEQYLNDDGLVQTFLQEHLLHFFEALSLIGQVSNGIRSLKLLEGMADANESPLLHAFIHDAKRFLLYNRSIIEEAPIQTYYSALVFAPQQSLVRKQFEKDMPCRIKILPKVRPKWSPLLQTLEGHTGWIHTVAFSSDGKMVASASYDGTVRLWDATTGRVLQILGGYTEGVSAMAFSPDGKIVASASYDKIVQLWDTATGGALQKLEGHTEAVDTVTFSPDGKLVASGSRDNTVRLWDTATGGALQKLEGHTEAVDKVTFSPDGKLVASGSHDNTVRLWDVATYDILRILKGHTEWISAVAFSPDGKIVASSSGDKTVWLWDVVTGSVLRILRGHIERIFAIAFSADGKMVASASYDKAVRLWDTATGGALQKLEGHTEAVDTVTFSPDGKLVASGSRDNTVRLWDAATGGALQTFKDHTWMVKAVTFSPDGKLVASGSRDNTVRLWDVATDDVLQTPEGHTEWISAVACSPDGKIVASSSGDKTVRLWDAATGEKLQTFERDTRVVCAIVFSPDSKLVASVLHDNTVRLWDTATGGQLQTLKGDIGRVSAVPGKLIALVSDNNTYQLWDAATGGCLMTHRGDTRWVYAIAFSPDGKLVASASGNNTIRLWDTAACSALPILKGHTDEISAVAFSLDGKLVASGSRDNTVRLWDAVTGSALLVLKGHTKEISAIAFSLDSKLVASGSHDNTVRLWDPATGGVLQILNKGHTEAVDAVTFSPDGKIVASSSGDKTVRLWDIATGGALQILDNHNEWVGAIAFSPDGLYIQTDRGLLPVPSDSTSICASHLKAPFLSRNWVTYNAQNQLWLPPGYRPSCSAFRGNLLVLGHSSGQVTFIQFKFS